MSDSATAERELLPPDQTFWKRHSPRHECPIAGSASMLLHLVALGGVVLAGLAMSWRWYGESTQPPVMGLAYIEGGPGDGKAPGGGEGSPRKSVENVASGPQTPEPPAPAPNTQAPLILPKPAATGEDPDPIVPIVPQKKEDKTFAKVFEDLKNSAAAANAQPNGVPNGNGGNGNGPGQGTGKGPGVGPGNGPGDGTGFGGATTKALQAQIRADRWHFDSGGSPRERIAKFAAVGITLGFTDFEDRLYIIKDVKRRPVEFRPDSWDHYKDVVKWANENDPVNPGLSRELGLPAMPRRFVLLLPPDREQKMADEEMRYAREKGHDFSKVEGTLFDFVLTRGVYEPVVRGQAPFDWKLPNGKARGK